MLKENISFLGILMCLNLMLHPNLTDGRRSDLNFLLVGNTGSGKSATGNSIIGQMLFATSAGVTSQTKDVRRVDSIHDGRKLTVVDTPGFVASNGKPSEYLSENFDFMGQAMRVSPQGCHVFLYVVPYGVRFTDEDNQTFNAMSNCFGKEYFSRYGVLIVTFGDTYDPEDNDGKSFSEWINTQDGVLNEMVNNFGGRVVLFDNKSRDQSKRTTQVDHLIKIVDQLSVIDSRYSSDHFERARYKRNRYAVEAKRSAIEKEVRKELRVVIGKLKEVKSKERLKQISHLHNFRAILDNLLRQIKREDRETAVLNNLITAIQKITDFIQHDINYLRNSTQENELQEYKGGGLMSFVNVSVKIFLSAIDNFMFRLYLEIMFLCL